MSRAGGSSRGTSAIAAFVLALMLLVAGGPGGEHPSFFSAFAAESAAAVAVGDAGDEESRHGHGSCEQGNQSDACPHCPACSGALPVGFAKDLAPAGAPGFSIYRCLSSEVAPERVPRPPRRS